MRIGIFTDSYYPHISGVTTSIEMLKTALEEMGHKVFLITPNLKDNRFIYDKINRTIWLPGIKTGIYKTKLTNIYSMRAMDIIKNEWNLDVIHSQTEFGIGYFSRIVSRRLKIPVVHTYHTLYEDYVYYVSKGHFDKFFKKLVVKLTRYYCDKRCDELIVPSQKIKTLFNEKYNIKRDVHVIPSGIDLRKFYPNIRMFEKIRTLKRKFKIKENDFIIGSVGRVASEKSFDKIIYNLRDLVKENDKIKFMLIGDGPELNNLKDLAKKLELEKNIIFTGLVDYEMIEYYYQLFDVMVSYSTTETQGLTIIEGLAATKPVICINDESFREMVQHEYNGFLINNDDEFKKAVLLLQHDGYLYSQMSNNAKNSTYQYSKEVFASNVLKVYDQAIQKKKSKHKKKK